jgi:hypothetical protein
MIGSGPLPYAEKMIGLPALPLLPVVSVSRHTPPALKATDCPGMRPVELTLAMVFQGAARDPGLESEPFTEST